MLKVVLLEDSSSSDEDPEAKTGVASLPPSEAEWLCKQQGLSRIKRDSKQNEVATRWSFASADTVGKSDYFLRDRGKHMAWAPNRNKNQHADNRNNEDQHAHGPSMLGQRLPQVPMTRPTTVNLRGSSRVCQFDSCVNMIALAPQDLLGFPWALAKQFLFGKSHFKISVVPLCQAELYCELGSYKATIILRESQCVVHVLEVTLYLCIVPHAFIAYEVLFRP